MELTNAELVNAVASHISDLTTEQVHTVLSALETVRDGDPVGTVRRDPQTGVVAHRVMSNGVSLWRVSGIDGATYNDLQPSLPWPVIFEAGS